MQLYEFGEQCSQQVGITSLMDDLGNALASGNDLIMMGGGNPGEIPQVQERFRQRLQQILDNETDFRRLIGSYDPPQGEVEFIRKLVQMLRREFGWQQSERHVGPTNGSQSAFFMPSNRLGGRYRVAAVKRI